jgi:hypothetical protein
VFSGIHDAVAVVDLRNGEKKTLVENAGSPKYAFSGHVLVGRNGVVYSSPFDLERLELGRSAVPVLEGAAMWSSPSISGFIGGGWSPTTSRATGRFCSRPAMRAFQEGSSWHLIDR